MPLPVRQYSLRMESLESRLVLDSTTVLNEIMYHPAGDDDPEWIELLNQMSVDMDLSGWTLGGGVEFRFPQGTVISGGGYLVISSDPGNMPAVAGRPDALGPFSGRLSNEGESLELRDNNDRLMSSVEYGDRGLWPVAPDGSGVSLAKIDANSASDAMDSWAASAQVGGTPGTENITRRPGLDPARSRWPSMRWAPQRPVSFGWSW